jgi:predicted GTPase
LQAGAFFAMTPPSSTMLSSRKPVIAVTGTRTGAGKSPVSRRVCELLKAKGLKPVIVRHPMPYAPLLSTQVGECKHNFFCDAMCYLSIVFFVSLQRALASSATRYIKRITRDDQIRNTRLTTRQAVQRFDTIADLDTAAGMSRVTVEEREEYEPHLLAGVTVYAGVDYAEILKRAEQAPFDVIVFDGGNNDTPLCKPDLWLCVADSLRAGDELNYCE